MKDLKISIAGDLGAGKSTVSELLIKKYGLEVISIGAIQREMAKKLGMETGDFNVHMQTHREFDKILDDILKSYQEKSGKYLFDSRMAWHFVPSAFSVYFKISPKLAAERVFNAKRETEKYDSVEDALLKLAKRRASEVLRYKTLYNVDITNLQNYNFVVEVDGKTPQQVCDEISVAFENYLKNND